MNAIKFYRTKKQLTQKELADRVGIDSRLVQKYENGETKVGNMRFENVVAFARELGIKISELLEDTKMSERYIGKKWGELTEAAKEMLLSQANVMDAITGNKPRETQGIIVDLTDTLSVSGKYVVGEDEDEIIIDDEAIIYNSEVGVIR